MLTAVTLFTVASFVALVLRRLKRDMDQEREFRMKLGGGAGKLLQVSQKV